MSSCLHQFITHPFVTDELQLVIPETPVNVKDEEGKEAQPDASLSTFTFRPHLLEAVHTRQAPDRYSVCTATQVGRRFPLMHILILTCGFIFSLT